MAATVAEGVPVWVWLPGSHDPVRCGRFALDHDVGRFDYDDAYRRRPDAVPLDPCHLPLAPAGGSSTETRLHGLFGIFHDMLPCDFGRALLEARHRRPLADDPLAILALADGDEVGAIAVGHEIAPRLRHRPPAADDLFAALARLPPDARCSQAIYAVQGLSGISLDHERPKLTVTHRGRHWLAKLQDPAVRAHAPAREFAAMRAARIAGLDVAEVELHRPGGREVLLVRRFDRDSDDLGRTTRRLYASAQTVLQLGDRHDPGERDRHSYVALIDAFGRFAGREPGVSFRRELWRRAAFNVICGNSDDHAGNHGFIYRDGAWRLAPAFDILPAGRYGGRQALALNRAGSCAGDRATLLSDCLLFGWDRAEADDFIDHVRGILPPAELPMMRDTGAHADIPRHAEPCDAAMRGFIDG